MKLKSYVIIILIIPFFHLEAQLKYDFTQFFNESVEFVQQPLKWDCNDWLKFGITGSGTLLLMTVDKPVRDEVLKDRRYYNSVPIVGGRIWGETYMPAIIFSGLAVQSLIFDDILTRKIAYEIGQAMIYSGTITYFLKIGLGRARPYLNNGIAIYRPFNYLTNDKYEALPSGHSTVAFALSTVLAKNTESVYLKIIAYTPAFFTMASRIYQDYHWTSDCFLGAAIGYNVGAWVADRHENLSGKTTDKASEYELVPYFDCYSYGLCLNVIF